MELGIYEDVEYSYKNYVLDVSFYNLESMGNAQVFSMVYEKIKKEIFKELGMEELKKEEINSWNEKYYEQYLQLKDVYKRQKKDLVIWKWQRVM